MPVRMCGHESYNVQNPAVTYKTSSSDHALQNGFNNDREWVLIVISSVSV